MILRILVSILNMKFNDSIDTHIIKNGCLFSKIIIIWYKLEFSFIFLGILHHIVKTST